MLSNAAVKGARPKSAAYKLWDQDGLYLHVSPGGAKAWRLRVRRGGQETTVSLGHWPELGLAEARDERDTRRAGGAAAIETARLSFADVAQRWQALHRSRWSAVHAADVAKSLARDVLPTIGAKPVDAIAAAEVLELLAAIEARGARETARRVRQRISGVFGYAIANGWAAVDPAARAGDALLGPSAARGLQPAVTTIEEARAVLACLDSTRASAWTRLAAQLLALTAVRTAALRGIRWSEIEGIDWTSAAPAPAALWRVPAARMKLAAEKKSSPAHDHLVPLAPAAVAVLRAARAIASDSDLVFRGLGEATLCSLHARAGLAGRHVPHGWRATFSTIMNERRTADRSAIDLVLAHKPKSAPNEAVSRSEGAYNRAGMLAQRRALLEEWADVLVGPTRLS